MKCCIVICCFSMLEGKGLELSWPLTEPLVLALEKYRLEKDKGSVKRVVEGVKGCVACSI